MQCKECGKAATVHVWDAARGELHYCDEHGGPHRVLGPVPFAEKAKVLTGEDVERGSARVPLTTGEAARVRLPECAREGDTLLLEWRIEELPGELGSVDFVDERFVLAAADVERGRFHARLADGRLADVAVPEGRGEGDAVLIPRQGGIA